MREIDRPDGCVYLIESPLGLFKIGRTFYSPEDRLKAIRGASGLDMTLVHKFRSSNMRSAERWIHDHLAAKRYRNEWFRLTPDDVQAFCSIRSWGKEFL